MKDSDDVQQLLRLKRYETPGEEYYDSFLDEFKDRQRSELLSRSSRSILAERVNVWFDELGGAKWLIPAGAAAAAIGVGVFVSTRSVSENTTVQPIVQIPANDTATDDNPAGSKNPESFELSIPRTDGRVPSLNEGMLGTPSGLLPTKFREL